MYCAELLKYLVYEMINIAFKIDIYTLHFVPFVTFALATRIEL